MIKLSIPLIFTAGLRAKDINNKQPLFF